MVTSLQYNFPTVDADIVIRDAFERCGIQNYMEDAVRYQSAKRSLNFLFQHWPNRGFNLFTLQFGVIQIISGQNQYDLPPTISKIMQCKNAKSNQILGGTATSSTGGDPSILFQTSITGSFAQTAPNGSISYLYTTGTPLLLIGVQSAISTVYKLTIECSYLVTTTEDDWITVLETPELNYYNGASQWFYLPFTKSAVNWRIRETGGATLNLVQIYFGIPYNSVPMKSVGNDLFFQFPSNSQQGTATTYWTNRQRIPTLNVWPVPDTSYQFFFYTGIRYIQDVGDFFNSLDIGTRFMEAATAGLAAKLAQKFAPERYSDLSMAAETVYIEAGREDTENVDSEITWATGEI